MNAYFDQMIEATSNFQNYDVLSHIDYAFKTTYLMDETKTTKLSIYEDKIKKVLNNLIKNDKSLGGVNLTISSDSHSCERYLSGVEYYQQIARECGFDHLVYFVNRKRYNYQIK